MVQDNTVAALSVDSSLITETDADVEGTVVSRGDVYAKHSGLSKTHLRRNYEKTTLTYVVVKTIVGSVPSEADVLASVTDMENLYRPSKDSTLLKPLSGLRISQSEKESSMVTKNGAPRPVRTPTAPFVPTPVVPSVSSKLSRLQSVRNIVRPSSRALRVHSGFLI